MSDKVSVEIISPNGSIIKTEAKEATIPSYEGEMGILKNHISLITFLRPGIIKISGDSEKNFFVEEGTVEFVNNNLLILTSSAKNISDMDKNFINNLIKESEEKIQKDEMSDKERYLLSYKIETLKNINP